LSSGVRRSNLLNIYQVSTKLDSSILRVLFKLKARSIKFCGNSRVLRALIWVPLGSDLGPQTGCLDWGAPWSYSVPPDKRHDKVAHFAVTVSFQNSSSTFLIPSFDDTIVGTAAGHS
jgi:hypothetical protein